MRFTGIPQVDAWNFYQQEQRKRDAFQVQVFRNNECYVKSRTKGEFCSFVDIETDPECSCRLRIADRHRNLDSMIIQALHANRLKNIKEIREGFLISDPNVTSHYFTEKIRRAAFTIRDRVCPFIR